MIDFSSSALPASLRFKISADWLWASQAYIMNVTSGWPCRAWKRPCRPRTRHYG